MYPISFPIIENFCMSTSSALIKLLNLKTPHRNRFFLSITFFSLFQLWSPIKPIYTQKQQPKNTTFLLNSITTNQPYPLLLNSAHTTAVAMATLRLSAHSEPSG